MPGIIKVGSEMPAVNADQERPYFHLQDLEQRSERFLAQVRKQAAEMLTQAQSQVASLRQETMAAAREDSLRTVRAEMQAESEKRLAALEPFIQKSLAQLRQELTSWRMDWESRTVGLAIEIARRICRHEFQVQPQIVLGQMEAALQLAGPDDSIELRVHPEDLDNFAPAIRALVARFGNISRTTIANDPQVAKGGCVVKTKYGEIDSQLESQLSRIEEELLP
jgi:flagellar assembly protein FliH